MNARTNTGAGTLAVLSVGAGDTTLSFDPANPAERIRAARIVRDMLRRGYALLVEVGTDANGKKQYTRALDFREDTCEYVIADLDPEIAAQADAAEERNGHEQKQVEPGAAAPAGAAPTPKRGRGAPRKALPAATTRAVSIGPIAGG